jgi:type I restriction enzyme S subunit
MSSNWPKVRLGDYCIKIGSGATPKGGKKVYLDEGEISLIRSQNVYNEGFSSSGLVYITNSAADKLRNVEVQERDILINITGDSVARVCMAPREYLPARVNQHVAIIRVDPTEFNPNFVRYFLSTSEQQRLLLTIASAGATRNALTKSQIENLEIIKPNLEKQAAIAQQLSSLEDKIKVNNQVNQTLEQIAQAIFKSWFVDFEPVKAKISALEAGGSEEDTLLAAMQAISGKDKAQLTRLQTDNPEHYHQLRTTAELFPSAMQDSELGEIPKGWKPSEIGKEVTVVGGATPSTKNPEFWDGGDIAWTSPRDLSNLTDKVLIDTERKITEAGLAKIGSGLLPINTVLMSSRAPVGYLALSKLPVAVNQGYIAMKCEKVLSPEFTLQWCSEHMDEIKNRASGTTFAEISKKNFKVIPVVVPQKDVIDAFSRQVRPLYSKIEINIRESHSLGLIRDSLLPKLLSGSLQAHNNEVETD